MALVLCKACKKAFFNSQEEEEVCSVCVARLRELYPSVRGFLRNHEKETYTIMDLSRAMDVTLSDLESMVAIGLLEYRTNVVAAPQKAAGKKPKGKMKT